MPDPFLVRIVVRVVVGRHAELADPAFDQLPAGRILSESVALPPSRFHDAGVGHGPTDALEGPVRARILVVQAVGVMRRTRGQSRGA